MYRKSVEVLVNELDSDLKFGLNPEQVQLSREENGINELKQGKRTSLLVKFLSQFCDVLIIILLIAGVVSILVDPSEWVESVIIFVVILINAVLGVFQENKAEKSLDALKKMSSPISKVLRNGMVTPMKSSDIVVGDIVIIEAGDFIPADARVIESANLQVDESALTGESLPVNKFSEVIKDDNLPLGDRKNMVFSSSFCTYGRGRALVTSVGMKTEVGHIASMLMDNQDSITPLQQKLNQVAKMIGILSLVICAIVFLMEWRFGLAGGVDWLEAFKSAVALAVAAVPEGLATVVTIVLAIGVSQMVKEKAIVKKLPAVETLGSTSIICSDKTGTLTQNKMTVLEVYNERHKQLTDLTDTDKTLISYLALCCDAKIEVFEGEEKRIGDPTEVSLIELNNKYGKDVSKIERLGEIPFDSERKLMTVVIKEGKRFVSITKGAPDIIFSNVVNKDAKAKEANGEMGGRALRVLGLAVKYYDEMPEIDFSMEKNMTFVGLVGMIDPPREEVKAAVAEAKMAGIRSIMITGDHVITATAIARQLGILGINEKAISSEELDKLSDDELFKRIEEFSVYARVAPKDKVRIVHAWQKHGHIVAMTGDGVNDSPALKAADIGCAMGITGTDVSKEAADMILVDDNFTTIVKAVRQGRGIYENVKNCVKYLLSSNIGEVVTIFFASLLGLIPALAFGIPLLPIHLLWINLITDTLPAIGLGMEKPADEIMKRKPRNKSEGFFANHLGVRIALEGLVIGLITLTVFVLGHEVLDGKSLILGQTMAFVTLSMTQLFHSFNTKSQFTVFSKSSFNNKFLNLSFVLGFLLQIGILYIPGINDVFNVIPLSFGNLMICFGFAFGIVIVMEISKLISKFNSKKA